METESPSKKRKSKPYSQDAKVVNKNLVWGETYFMYVDHPGGLRYVWGSNVSREKGIDREKPPLLPSLFLPEGFFLQPHYYCLAMAKQAALVHISYQPFLPFGYVVVI